MIDWTTVILPFPHTETLRGGIFMELDQDGEIKWQKNKGLRIQGSHESSLLISTDEHTPNFKNNIWISGNPAKFLYGHNVTGTDDICRLVADMGLKIAQHLAMTIDPEQQMKWRRGQFILKKVDINYMRACGSREAARDILRAIAYSGCMRHGGRGEFSGSTLYFGKKSRRRAIKIYCKGDELESSKKSHQIPDSLGPLKAELLKIADDALRIETVLHSLELKDLGLQYGRDWTPATAKLLFDEYVGRIKFSHNTPLSRHVILSLAPCLQRTYALWKEGVDLRAQFKPATYYRHRRELLTAGIDIGAQPLPAE